MKYACSLCKKEFKFEDVRYGNNGKIVCIDCYKQSSQDSKKTEIVLEQEKKKTKNEDIKIICKDCRYKFILKKKIRGAIRCPYCSGNNLMKDDITARTLIEEVSKVKDI